MAADPPNLSNALLKWVQTFSTDPPVSELSDLRDGHLIQQILHNIDPNYFAANGLPADASDTASNWVQRWQNLKHIQHEVEGYLRDVCEVEGETAVGQANLKGIAQAESDAADVELVQMLKSILRAAMYSPESNQRMGRVVVGLGAEVAGTIAAAMAGMEEERFQDDSQISETVGEHGDTPSKRGTLSPSKDKNNFGDMELEHEEKLISAHRIIRQLEESNSKAALELEDLRTEKKRIEDAFEALQQDSQQGSHVDDDHLRSLRDRSDKDKDYIAELETELETSRSTAESQARQLERLKGSADSIQQLKDDVQLLRAERDDLISKSRTNENLRKKIQNLQDAERQSSQLREDLRTAQDQLSTLDTLRNRCEALQKTNAENMNIIASSEQEIFDMRSNRKRLEHELRVLGQKYDIARERQSRDYETITELEGRLAQLQTTGDDDQRGLGDEMDKADRPRPSSLRTVSVNIPGGIGSAEGLLEERLAALSRRNKALEEQYLDLLSDKLGLETALSELREGNVGATEQNVPFLEQRAKLQNVSKELDLEKARTHQLTAQLAETHDRLIALQAGTEVEAIDAAKEHASLTEAFAALNADAEKSRADLEEHRALLSYALLSARGIATDPEEERQAKERALAMKLVADARAADEANLPAIADSVVARVTAARLSSAPAAPPVSNDDELAALRAELAASQAQIKTLQETTAAPPDEQMRADIQEQARAMAQLRRENALMSSAWYDLSARLQRENVMLGRRRESPKSWLGKQRAAVGLGK